MTRWQLLADSNPSASPDQKTLLGLMVVAELENLGSAQGGDPQRHHVNIAFPASSGLDDVC